MERFTGTPVKIQCPRQENHEQHFWKFSDEDDTVLRDCAGYLTITVDIFDRPKGKNDRH